MVFAYDLLEDRRTTYVIITKFFLRYFFLIKMGETFANLEDILPDWVKDDIEESLAQAMALYEKQEEQKTRFFVEDIKLQNILEQLQSNATKRDTKWVVKLFQGKDPMLCFVFNKLIKQDVCEINSKIQLFSVSKYLFTQIGVTKETPQHRLLKWERWNKTETWQDFMWKLEHKKVKSTAAQLFSAFAVQLNDT